MSRPGCTGFVASPMLVRRLLVFGMTQTSEELSASGFWARYR
jgi:hypothetical protein